MAEGTPFCRGSMVLVYKWKCCLFAKYSLFLWMLSAMMYINNPSPSLSFPRCIPQSLAPCSSGVSVNVQDLAPSCAGALFGELVPSVRHMFPSSTRSHSSNPPPHPLNKAAFVCSLSCAFHHRSSGWLEMPV